MVEAFEPNESDHQSQGSLHEMLMRKIIENLGLGECGSFEEGQNILEEYIKSDPHINEKIID